MVKPAKWSEALFRWYQMNPHKASENASRAARYMHHYRGHHDKKMNPLCEVCKSVAELA